MKLPFKIKLWVKIFAACSLITIIAVGSTGFMSYWMLQKGRRDRGHFLDKHIKRYRDYVEGVGASIETIAQVLATDPRVLNVLEDIVAQDPKADEGSQSSDTSSPPATPEADASTDSEETTGALSTRKKPMGKKGKGHYKKVAMQKSVRRMIRGIKGALAPDFLLVVDSDKNPVYQYSEKALDMVPDRQLVITNLLNKVPVSGETMVLAKNGYLVSGAPVLSTKRKGHVLGAILIGVDLERYFHNYRVQSDNRIPKQHRLVLVNRSGEILTSVFPKNLWSTLEPQIQKENRVKVYEGNRKVEVIEWADKVYDFTSLRVTGYEKDYQGVVGRLYLLRIRQKEDVLRDLMGYIFPAAIAISVFSLLVASILSFWITGPIRTFIHATRQIVAGGGDLTKRIKVSSKDEMGDLADSLNQLFDRLQEITAHVQQSSFQVGTSSTELSASSNRMLDGAKEQAVKIENSTAAVTELSSSIQQVADNAMQTTKVAKATGNDVTQAVTTMNEIKNTVEDAGFRITELGESGKRIGKIVEVIRQISEQTSLLALNASIEAAHAGEHGRGFAVVADEVSSLARRVGQSAKDIEDLIATITEQTAEAVRTMGVAIEEVEGGTSLVKNTLGSIQEIVDVISDTATAVQEQALASDEIARNMDVVQRIAQEVLNSSEEAVLQGERLQELGFHLEELVKGFKVGTMSLSSGPLSTTRALNPPQTGEDDEK